MSPEQKKPHTSMVFNVKRRMKWNWERKRARNKANEMKISTTADA